MLTVLGLKMEKIVIKGFGVYLAASQPWALVALFSNRQSAEQLARTDPEFKIKEYHNEIEIFDSLHDYGNRRARKKITDKLTDFELQFLGVTRDIDVEDKTDDRRQLRNINFYYSY